MLDVPTEARRILIRETRETTPHFLVMYIELIWSFLLLFNKLKFGLLGLVYKVLFGLDLFCIVGFVLLWFILSTFV